MRSPPCDVIVSYLVYRFSVSFQFLLQCCKAWLKLCTRFATLLVKNVLVERGHEKDHRHVIG
jgi:hypothetical protein